MSDPQWVKCKNGHLYDPAESEECPHCPSSQRGSGPSPGRVTPITGDLPLDVTQVTQSTARLVPDGTAGNQGGQSASPGTVVDAPVGGGADFSGSATAVDPGAGSQGGIGSGPGTVVEGAPVAPASQQSGGPGTVVEGVGSSPAGPTEGGGAGRSTRMVSLADQQPPPPTMPIFAWLVVLEGSQQYVDFRIDGEQTYLGGDASCQIIITDEFASGEHASIRFREGRFTLTDLDSRNGTFVNDFAPEARIDRVELNDGDEIRIGQTLLKFKCL